MKVAIIAAGEMGSGLAARLKARGAVVLTSLDGRGPASAERAANAGMMAVGSDAELVAGADMVLSVLPPARALALATRLAPALASAAGRVTYADCNAVAPSTVRAIAAVIEGAGAPFVDVGIVGGPPKGDDAGPRLYVSGPAASALAPLADFGLDVRVMEGPLGAASGLKMAYASITKGFTALGANLGFAPLEEGAGSALSAELRASQPQLHAWLARQTPTMFPKAYRWDGEMEEIAKFLGEAPGAGIFNAAAALYRDVATAWATGEDAPLMQRLRALLPPQ